MQHKRVYTIPEAIKKMEYYCAYQERCHKEVEQKLHAMCMIPDAISFIIAHLIKHNFLNEERFAKAFAMGKFRIKKWGRNRITNELKQRDISVYNIKLALGQFKETDYMEMLEELAQKKNKTITENNIWKRRKKLTDYLLYRGWEPHLVYNTVTNLVQ